MFTFPKSWATSADWRTIASATTQYVDRVSVCARCIHIPDRTIWNASMMFNSVTPVTAIMNASMTMHDVTMSVDVKSVTLSITNGRNVCESLTDSVDLARKINSAESWLLIRFVDWMGRVCVRLVFMRSIRLVITSVSGDFHSQLPFCNPSVIPSNSVTPRNDRLNWNELKNFLVLVSIEN